MAIWIGEAGGLRIGTAKSEKVYARIDPADVSPDGNRFSFEDARYTLITGDKVWIRRIEDDGSPSTEMLDFVDGSGWGDGQQHPDGEWYVNADAVGGIRLFKDWKEAVNNTMSAAVRLVKPAAGYRVTYEVVETPERCLAQTISWTLNTDRETADFTALGDSFRQNMATLVSGSGEIDCFFDLNLRDGCQGDGTQQPSIYMHQLALRQEIGSNFKGVFLMKQSGATPIDTLIDIEEQERSLFYYADCVITSVATELSPGEPIHSRISFVTTGPIQLLFDFPRNYLLQEQPPNDKILKESGFGILLETPA